MGVYTGILALLGTWGRSVSGYTGILTVLDVCEPIYQYFGTTGHIGRAAGLCEAGKGSARVRP